MAYLLIPLFVILIIGAASLTVSFFLYGRLNEKWVWLYILFLVVFLLQTLLGILLVTFSIDFYDYYTEIILLNQVSRDINLLMIFWVPFAFYQIVPSLNDRIITKRILTGVWVLSGILTFLPYFVHHISGLSGIMPAVNNTIRAGILAVFVFLVYSFLISYSDLKNDLFRAGVIISMLIFFISYLFFDAGIRSYIIGSAGSVRRPLIFLYTIYYAFWNTCFLVITVAYIKASKGLKYADQKLVEPGVYFLKKFDISDKEAEVINLILKGMGTQDIADRLFRSPKTIKNHISSIYNKTGVKNRMDLAFLIQQGKNK